MNRNYKSGAAREYRIMKKLEKEGWFCIRSAGSHSPIDIIALRRNLLLDILEIRFIQSKKTGYLSPQERAEKEELENKLGIKIEVI
jgi:Holliday junction resolvase